MASEQHDFILSMIARKIQTYGFSIVNYDGKTQNTCQHKFDIPPQIIHHKPDIIGEKEGNILCIGEAKTKNDIFTKRTKNQIIDFLYIVGLHPQNRLIIGVPTSALSDLYSVLRKLGVDKNIQLEIIHIPEALLPHEEEI
jgi:hypothetical protein